MSKKFLFSNYYLLIFVLIIAAFLRLYNITQVPPGLYPDEAMNGNNALEALGTGHFKVFYPENNGREGLFINIQALSIWLFGNEPWALRVVSVIFGILTVLGVYFLARELFSQKIALLSAFLLATSFWHINFSRIGFRAIMAPFFMTWALYFLLKSLKAESYKLKTVLSGIFFGLGFHSYIAYRATPALILVVLAYDWFKHKESRKKLILATSYFILATIITAAPLGLYFLKNLGSFFGRTGELSITHSATPLRDLVLNIVKTAGMFNFAGDWNWRHNYAGRPELFWPVGILLIIGIFLGLKMFFKKVSRRLGGQGFAEGEERSRESSGERLAGARDHVFREEYFQSFLILFSWLIIAALPVLVSNEGLPHALRSIIMIPPVFILAGFGGVYLYEVLKKYVPPQHHRIIHYSLFIILLLLIFEAYTTYFVRWARNPNVQGAFSTDYAWVGYGLRALPKELPKYVIVEAQGIDVRGIPMPAQTVMFLTDTFTPEKQKEKNIYYVLPNKTSRVPTGAYTVELK